MRTHPTRSQSWKRHLKWTIAVPMLAALALATALAGGKRPLSAPVRAANHKPAGTDRSRQIAHVDPATGQLTQRPSQAQLATQGAVGGPVALNRSFDGLVEQVLPNGAIMVS